jgi:hypothetical protein
LWLTAVSWKKLIWRIEFQQRRYSVCNTSGWWDLFYFSWWIRYFCVICRLCMVSSIVQKSGLRNTSQITVDFITDNSCWSVYPTRPINCLNNTYWITGTLYKKKCSWSQTSLSLTLDMKHSGTTGNVQGLQVKLDFLSKFYKYMLIACRICDIITGRFNKAVIWKFHTIF